MMKSLLFFFSVEIMCQSNNIFGYCDSSVSSHAPPGATSVIFSLYQKEECVYRHGGAIEWNYNKHKLDPWHWPFLEKS